MSMRGIRGAITVEQNEKEAIWQAAKAMMQELIARNELAPEDIGAVIFSMTEDLTAAFPTAGCASCRASTSCHSSTRASAPSRAASGSASACSCSLIRRRSSAISATSIWGAPLRFVRTSVERLGKSWN